MNRRATGSHGLFAAAVAALAGAATVGCGDDTPPLPAPIACEAAPGVICTVAGTGIAGDGADDLAALTTRLYLPQDVTVGPDGRLYIVDWNNHRIRVRQDDGTLHIVAGIGELGPASDDPTTNRLNHPTQVTFDPAGNMLISDQANDRIRKVDAATQTISTIAGVGPCADCALGDGGPATGAFISLPQGQSARPAGRIDIDAAGNIYIADTNNNRVRKIDAGGVITTVAGTAQRGFTGDGGPATEATLNGPQDVAVGPDGIYIADTGNDCVRVIHDDGTIATAAGTCGSAGIAGDGGPATTARLDTPGGIALGAEGNLYIADTHNQRIRVVYR